MKRLTILLAFVAFAFSGQAQTVENIRVTQDGDQLKITYRIGASTESQLFNVFLSCSMAGESRFEPEAVIGDVGENVIGGKSYYTVMWDVFEDVDEVIDPNITVRVELVSDASVGAANAATTRQVQEEAVKQEPVQKPVQETKQAQKTVDPVVKETSSSKPDPFKRNGFFSYSGMAGFGLPIGISFGSLNNWGYYVTPMRMGIKSYDFSYYDISGYLINDTELDFHYMLSAGLTKHFVSAGFYRLHGYWGLGTHSYGQYLKGLVYDPAFYGHFMIETGIVNVIGGFNVTLGFAYSAGYAYPTNLIFGVGFVF
jgi:hypothetical protein